MIYLDTGCLLKLYYPEPESAAVARLVAGEAIAFLGVHDLELSNALELELFHKGAKPSQVRAVRGFVEDDLRAGVLHRPHVAWDDVLRDAKDLAIGHTRRLGCRSLDIVHCAAARALLVTAFISTDARQRRLARAIGLPCPSVA